MAVELLRRRFTVEEYQRMGRAGIFSEDDRVELIEGEIVEMTPIGSRHAACVKRLNSLFSSRLGERAIVSVQDPLNIGARSEPQPDLMLLEPRLDFYAHAHPEPKDVLLIVEVADTSLDYDRKIKIPLYAQASIPEVWLVDLNTSTVELHLDPSPQGYKQVRSVRQGESLAPQAVPGLVLAVADILGGD